MMSNVDHDSPGLRGALVAVMPLLRAQNTIPELNGHDVSSHRQGPTSQLAAVTMTLHCDRTKIKAYIPCLRTVDREKGDRGLWQ